MAGAPYYPHSSSFDPRHVTRVGRVEGAPAILEIPASLDAKIDYLYPDALAVSAERHSDRCYSLYILDLDYRYNYWRAHLSEDNRWTISPVDVACYDELAW